MTLLPAIYRFTFSFLFSILILLMGNVDLLFKWKLGSYTSAFNLDVSLPFTKKGPAGSYFGFSVAQHLMWNQKTSNHIPVLLIGAPKDNITSMEAPPEVRNIVRPGSVYRCSISMLTDDCRQLEIDLEIPSGTEDKMDQWMGGVVTSQGTEMGLAMVCAHRFKTFGPSYKWGPGWCISLSNALDEDRFWEPCNGRPTGKGHSEYGYCQAGISATIGKDGDILIGSPGPYNWRGTVFSNTLHSNLSVFRMWHQSPVEDLAKDQQGPGPATGYYSYLGMSVKVGNLIGGQKTFVSGAPRSNNNGQVLLFHQINGDLRIDPQHYLTGEQFGSGFGYAIAIDDFNADGMDDLVVGSPFYHKTTTKGGAVYIYINSHKGITSQSEPVRLVNAKMKDTDCDEMNCYNSWFGGTIEPIGDLDLDGYRDLAIGAPYEGRGVVYIYHGSSLGIAKSYSQRVSAADLVIPLQAFGYSISGGVDMDSNGYPDLLVGAYASDSAVVLWSRPVVDVTVTIETSPSVIDPRLSSCLHDGQPYNCFLLTVCLSARAREQISKQQHTRRSKLGIDTSLEVDVRLEAESFSGTKLVRVSFQHSSQNTSSVYSRRLMLPYRRESAHPDNSPICFFIISYLANNNKDFLNPVQFLLTYELVNKQAVHANAKSSKTNEQSALFSDTIFFPILSQDASPEKGILHSVDFIKNCGNDQICSSNLKVQGFLQLIKDELGNYILRSTEQLELKLFVRVTNTLEDAHEAILVVLLPSYLKYRGTDGDYFCTPSEGVISCTVGNPLLTNQEASLVIRLDASSVDFSVHHFNIELFANTTSVEVDAEDNVDTLKVRVNLETDLLVRGTSEPSVVFYSGRVIGQSAVQYLNEIGPEIQHSYEVKNVGRSKVPSFQLDVSWPYEIEEGYPLGKHLLYLTDAPHIDGSGHCFIDDRIINKLDFKIRKNSTVSLDFDSLNETSKFRIKRNAEAEKQSTKPLVKRHWQSSEIVDSSGKRLKIISLDCDLGSAKCYQIRCTIESLKPGQSVVVSLAARLWTSTFIEDFGHVDQVHIFSKAVAKLNDSLNVRQVNQANDLDKALTVVLADVGVKEPSEIPLWIIIVSVCLGILFLCFIICLLWKCGFFRRKQPSDMIQYRAVIEKPNSRTDILEQSSLTLPRYL